MKKKTILMTILTLALLGMSISLAWYHNNRQVGILGGGGTNSIKIRSSGVLQVAYAVDTDLEAPLPISDASFSSSLEMKLNGKSYEDITGNGLIGQMFSPTLNEVGNPEADAALWKEATVDNAAVEGDSGQYIIADLYFRSDSPMDIYLLKDSRVQPRSSAVSGENDLTNRAGINELWTSFRDFPDGLPPLNINQSSHGFFSRNLIAGAARVSFTEYDYENSQYPTAPGVIWVPNTEYQLIAPDDSAERLSSFKTEGGEEENSYSYYQYSSAGTTGVYSTKTVKRNANNGNKITGELYRKTDDGMIEVAVTTMSAGMLVPGIAYTGVSAPVPAIWDGSQYINAASVKDSTGNTYLVAADYNESRYAIEDGFAYRASINDSPIYVQRSEDGYCEVGRGSTTEDWVATGVSYTEEADIAAIEASFQRDSAGADGYLATRWIDSKRDFTQVEENNTYSDVKIGTTNRYANSCYYTRIQIAVWVEGTDREAKIQLNGGEFDINLQFFGVSRDEEE